MSVGHVLDRKQESHVKILEQRQALKVKKASDKSEYQPQFELTHRGEPINMTEYAVKISAHKSTHVIQLDAFNSLMGPLLKATHLEPNPVFHEEVLAARPGRVRHTFIS